MNELASRTDRLIATLIDGIPFLVFALITRAASSAALSLIVMLAMIGYLVYQCVLLTKSGQTIGKKYKQIKIVKVDTGENGGFVTNVLLRGFLNGLISVIPLYGLIDILFIFRDDRRCVHDMIASTRVVKA